MSPSSWNPVFLGRVECNDPDLSCVCHTWKSVSSHPRAGEQQEGGGGWGGGGGEKQNRLNVYEQCPTLKHLSQEIVLNALPLLFQPWWQAMTDGDDVDVTAAMVYSMPWKHKCQCRNKKYTCFFLSKIQHPQPKKKKKKREKKSSNVSVQYLYVLSSQKPWTCKWYRYAANKLQREKLHVPPQMHQRSNRIFKFYLRICLIKL